VRRPRSASRTVADGGPAKLAPGSKYLGAAVPDLELQMTARVQTASSAGGRAPEWRLLDVSNVTIGDSDFGQPGR
jgi:hypothetical protein